MKMSASTVLVSSGTLLLLFAVLSFVAGLPAINLMPRESAVFLAVSFAFAGVVFWVSCAVAREPGGAGKGGEGLADRAEPPAAPDPPAPR
jgi:hypothetical protein